MVLCRLAITYLKSGDHVIVSDVTYEAVWRLFNELLPERYGIEATFVDISDLAAVRSAHRKAEQTGDNAGHGFAVRNKKTHPVHTRRVSAIRCAARARISQLT